MNQFRAVERCHNKVFPLECITELLSQTKANRDRQIEVVTQEKQMREKEDEKGFGVPSCCFNTVLQKTREIGRGD